MWPAFFLVRKIGRNAEKWKIFEFTVIQIFSILKSLNEFSTQ